jgi:predicted NUDIX family NTP pyrophosphohydrolase
MPKVSAGILLWRGGASGVEVFLVHPGGPFWRNKDEGAWSIPKGEAAPGEDLLGHARREFEEETGAPIHGDFRKLGPTKQPGGKLVHAFAVEGDFDPGSLRSDLFEMEWPPRSGRRQSFPEVDRAAWFSFAAAREKILKGQVALLDELEALVSPPTPGGAIRRATSRRCG